jgi:hypothetical protein
VRKYVSDLGLWWMGSTYSDHFIFSTGGEVPSVGAEAHTTNVKVAVLTGAAILQVADLLSGIHIKDLSTAIATSSNVAAIMAESNTAHHTLMRKIVHQIDIESARRTRVINSMPVFTHALEMRRQLLRVKVR